MSGGGIDSRRAWRERGGGVLAATEQGGGWVERRRQRSHWRDFQRLPTALRHLPTANARGKKGTPSLSAGGASCGIWRLQVPGGPKAGRIEARSGMLVEVIWQSASTLPPRATLSLPQCPKHRHSGADGRQGDGSRFGNGDDAVLDEQIRAVASHRKGGVWSDGSQCGPGAVGAGTPQGEDSRRGAGRRGIDQEP